jgi:D-beta-D-heptose 7-phosphate kinase/D-beta-D-heptose 1-phosphate adenosyltransferase
MENLHKFIDKFKDINLLVVGDLMLDIFIYGNVDRISPEAPVPVVEITSEKKMPGGAANVAKNLTTLGVKVDISGIASKDENGKTLLDMLKKDNINCSLFIDDGRTTSVKTRIIGHNQQMVRVDKEEKTKLEKKFTKQLLDNLKDKINQYDGIIISDYGKGMITEYLLEELTKICKENNKIVTVDPKIENFYFYKNVTCLTPNNKEASEATNMKIDDTDSLVKCGNYIMEKLNSNSLLITRGSKGMTLFTKDEEPCHINAVAKEVYDVTGAGDTVISVFTAALCAGASLKEATILSNAAAGIVVAKVGTATVSPDELKANLSYFLDKMGVN